jgi:hypothetical protein
VNELRVVGEILEAAAAAGGKVRARRVDPLGPGTNDLGRERLGVTSLDLRHSRPHPVAGKSAPDEDDEAVEPSDAVAAVRERVDVELQLVAFGDGGGHRQLSVVT